LVTYNVNIRVTIQPVLKKPAILTKFSFLEYYIVIQT